MAVGFAALVIVAALVAAGAWRRRSRRRRAAAWRRAHQLFTTLVELPPGERARALAEATAEDPTLGESVTRLLAAHDVTGPLDRMQSRLNGHAPVAPAALATGSDENALVAGHYALLGRLGAGGMGEVHRARDTRLGREVALKFLATEGDATSTARDRFIREARAAAALDHPNLCTVHEIGEAGDGRLFIAMALYEGETLADRIARGPLEWTEAMAIARQVARGLACAHAAGVVHRDIKPANVCITRDGVAKVVDFGIAMVSGTTIGDAGPLLGTVAYMSPEQVSGELVDARTDLWSLGLVCYEMLTGSRLFAGADWLRVMAAIRADEPVPLGALRGTAPLPVIRVIRELLERDPARRPASADQFERLLEEALLAAERERPVDVRPAPALAPGGERRQLTVLACRIAESASELTALADEVVARHGGHGQGRHGGILEVIFGVPVTHEDDQLRAARAAAELHELAGLGAGRSESDAPQVAAGIASGTVDVVEDPERPGHFRLGSHLARDARRLAVRADPGVTLIRAPNQRILGPQFTITPLELRDHALVGSPGDVACLEPIVGRHHDPAVPAPDRLTALAGRRVELDALRQAHDVLAGAEGRVVTVTGEAGSGKSRLVLEFLATVDRAGSRVVDAHCASYEGSKPYHPWIEVIRQLLGLDEADPTRHSVDAVTAAIARIDPVLCDFVPVYLHLLSIGTDPAALATAGAEPARQAIRDALAALVTQAALQRPLVLVLEDWHWADDASGDVLLQLAGVIPSYPVLLVVTQRTEEAEAWAGASQGLVLRLAPLSPADTATMASALLEGSAIPEAIGRALHERTGGNPFYLEELCRSLQEAQMLRIENGGAVLSREQEHLHLPATIQGVIRSRLDRLPPEAREVVRAAAILGREFTRPLLLRMGLERYELGQVMRSLTATGLVQQTRVIPERAYRFRHALIHEVAHDTLPSSQRRTLHQRAARALLAAHGDQLDEYAARIAHQFEGGEEWLEAARHACMAARRSRQLHEPADALATVDRADAWLDREPPGPERDQVRMEVLLEAETLCETLGLQDRQAALLDRMLELPVVQDDPIRLAEIHRRRGDRFTLSRDFGPAREALDLALGLARAAGAAELEGKVLRSLGLMGWHGGQLEGALAHVEAAIALERSRDDMGALGISLAARSQLLKAMGRSKEALEGFDEALRSTETVSDPIVRATVLYGAATLCRTMGDLDRAAEFLRRAAQAYVARDNPVHKSFNLMARAHVHLQRGDLEQALALALDAVEQARRGSYADGLARSLHSLGELLASLDRNREALGHFEESAELYQRLGRDDLAARLWARLATLAERIGESVIARRGWEHAVDLARSRGDADGEIRARLGAARTSRRSIPGSTDVARAELEAARDAAREAGLLKEEADASNSLGVLEWERGAHAEALPHFEAALRLFTQLEDTLHAAVLHNAIGATLRQLGRGAAAASHLERACDLARRCNHPLVEGHALALLGELALEADDATAARCRFTASLANRRAIGDQRGEGWMHEALARVALRTGRTEAALTELMRARGIALALGDRDLLAACESQPHTQSLALEG